MKVLKQVLDFYINSSLHVAFAAFSMAWITLLIFEKPFDEWVLLFIFFATITGYNFVKYFGLAKFHHRSLAGWLKVIQIFSMVCFLGLCVCCFYIRTTTLICIAVLGMITFLYAIPFLPEHLLMDDQKNLRNIGGLKVYVIALVWSGATVMLPLLNHNYDFDGDVWLTAFQRFLFVIIWMLPFEIRDLQYDSLKLATIPQKIGIKRTKIAGIILGMMFLLLEFLKSNIDSKGIFISFLITTLMISFLVFSRKNQAEYYSSFWVEGIPLIWLGLHLFF